MKKILLVDDSNTMLLVEQMVLNSSGFQLLTAKDGEAGIRAARAHRPDLILLDAMMPEMDGSETCRQLRAHEATRETPIVLMTKPINGNELLSKVKHLLGD